MVGNRFGVPTRKIPSATRAVCAPQMRQNQSANPLLLFLQPILLDIQIQVPVEARIAGWGHKCAAALALIVRKTPDPIFKPPPYRLLFVQLCGDLPIGNSFSTLTSHELRKRTFTVGCFIDERGIRYRSLAVWANNIVFHLLPFPKI